MIINDVSNYTNLLVAIAHIICNHPSSIPHCIFLFSTPLGLST